MDWKSLLQEPVVGFVVAVFGIVGIGLVKLESKLHGTRFERWYILSYRCRSLVAER